MHRIYSQSQEIECLCFDYGVHTYSIFEYPKNRNINLREPFVKKNHFETNTQRIKLSDAALKNGKKHQSSNSTLTAAGTLVSNRMSKNMTISTPSNVTQIPTFVKNQKSVRISDKVSVLQKTTSTNIGDIDDRFARALAKIEEDQKQNKKQIYQNDPIESQQIQKIQIAESCGKTKKSLKSVRALFTNIHTRTLKKRKTSIGKNSDQLPTESQTLINLGSDLKQKDQALIHFRQIQSMESSMTEDDDRSEVISKMKLTWGPESSRKFGKNFITSLHIRESTA